MEIDLDLQMRTEFDILTNNISCIVCPSLRQKTKDKSS